MRACAGNNFKVVVRVRPPLPRELNGDKRFQNIARIENERSITISENLPALDDPRADEASAAVLSLLLLLLLCCKQTLWVIQIRSCTLMPIDICFFLHTYTGQF